MPRARPDARPKNHSQPSCFDSRRFISNTARAQAAVPKSPCLASKVTLYENTVDVSQRKRSAGPQYPPIPSSRRRTRSGPLARRPAHSNSLIHLPANPPTSASPGDHFPHLRGPTPTGRVSTRSKFPPDNGPLKGAPPPCRGITPGILFCLGNLLGPNCFLGCAEGTWSAVFLVGLRLG